MGDAGRARPVAPVLRRWHGVCPFCSGRWNAIVVVTAKEIDMNWDRARGNWKQLRGKVKEQWGKLTDDSLDVIDGRREILLGKVQEAYGISKDQAEREIEEWEAQHLEDDSDVRASRRSKRVG
jgi:uncharacterized protein YjbJ (UPF0337 family)